MNALAKSATGRTIAALALGLVTILALGAVTVRQAGAATSDPHLTRVSVAAKTVHPGDVLTIDAAAKDLRSNDYTVYFAFDTASADMVRETCAGNLVGSPSPDTPACEYDDFTTTTRTTTHTSGYFLVASGASRTFSITVCAESMSGGPAKPGHDGGCRIRTFRVR
jgi:hypothetical protein